MVFCIVALITACNEDSKSGETTASDNQPDSKDVIAKVNDAVITKTELETFKTLKGNPSITDDKILDELIATELLKQEAEKEGLLSEPDVKFQLRLQEMEIAARALLRSKFAGLTIPDDEIKAEYEKQIQDLDTREYKARHILVKTKDEANAIIEALRNGADFVALAKERSTGPSGQDGGDLGWFKAQSMVPEFAEALKPMQPGDVSTEPVQTQFGFHVIKLEDVRDTDKPSLESVRAQIQQSLITKKITDYVETIKSNAKIERK